MTARDQFGAVRIARDETVDDLGMVVLDIGPHLLHAEAEGNETRHLVEETGERPAQSLVSGSHGDRHVEATVCFEKEIDLIADIHHDAVAASSLESLKVSPVHSARCSARGERLEHDAKSKDLIDISYGDRRNAITLTRYRYDEAFLNEALQRDPTTCLAEFVALHDFGFGEPRAGQDPAGNDRAAHQIVGLIGPKRRRRHGQNIGLQQDGFVLKRVQHTDGPTIVM